MKFTLAWLKEHLDSEATAGEVAQRLTMLGLEVESVTDRGKDLGAFVVGRVVAAQKHPDADRLTVCTVETGTGTVQVICGAPNARQGMKGVFAPAGAFIPGKGIQLKKAKIRGVDSEGMLLSEMEMCLSEEHEGIIELPADATIGAKAIDVMGLADPVIEIKTTPNRADCLGVRGIARDLAAAGVGKLKPLIVEPVPGAYPSPIRVHLDFDEKTISACPTFVGRMIRGVKNGPSPKWLQDKLTSVGLRPISALVDITNLMTLDLNRPLHVFDADKVAGNIHVRLSHPGERLKALNGKEYVLEDGMTVIGDEKRALGLGGVVGGEETGCNEATQNVFIESATFDPVRTAATGRRLGITSDARYRFERGVDPAFLVPGIEIATRLVLDLCGGEPSEIVVAGAEPQWRRAIPLRVGRVTSLAGVKIPRPDIERMLRALGCEVDGEGDSLSVQVPSWRADIVGEACLVEEVVRIHGYDRIQPVPLTNPASLPRPAVDTNQRRRGIARRTLAGRGLVEAVTFSFLSAPVAELFGGVPPSLRLVNPISADLDAMRPGLLPNLITASGRNAAHGIADAALFEVGPQYAGDKPEDQSQGAAGIRVGQTGDRHWAERERPVDAFDAKADALAVLSALGLTPESVTIGHEAPAWYHPGRSGTLRQGPKTILAAFGEIHPRVLARMDVKGPVAAFEIFLDRLPKPKEKRGAARPPLQLSAFQPVARDFAFVLDSDVPAATVVRAARDADKALIGEVRVFDVFAGAALGQGKKSIAVNVVLQPKDRTLTDQEIDQVSEKIVASVTRATGGALRT
ncbi:MAG: phenylalanine--tRNA ligase subunit beta [Rhodospirillales bacterium]|nr:phenylalanine--tRNA ligase subunit beta [Rhodospirillales bacterium]